MNLPSALLFTLLAVSSAGLPQGRAQDTIVLFETLDGRERSLPLAELDTASMGDAVFLRFQGAEAPAAIEAAEVCELDLLCGDRLYGRVSTAGDERLAVVLAGATRLTLGLSELRSLRFPARVTASDKPPEPPAQGDRLYRVLPRGVDRVDGLLVGFSDEGVLFESSIGERAYAWDDVAALYIEPLEAPPELDADAGARVLLDLAGGGRLTAALSGLEPAGVRVRSAGGEDVILPPGLISELLVDNGKYAFLGWLPVDAGPQLSPFDPPGAEPLGMVWPHRVDRAVDGSTLRTGGRDWARGIGVHAPSRLTFDLAGEWSGLRVAVGLDEPPRGTAAKGTVRFRVFVDGAERFESTVLQTGDAALQLPVLDLSGGQELVLEVDDGGDGAVMDRANWLRPVLVKD